MSDHLVQLIGARNVRVSEPEDPSRPSPLGLHIRGVDGQIDALPLQELQIEEPGEAESSAQSCPTPCDRGER